MIDSLNHNVTYRLALSKKAKTIQKQIFERNIAALNQPTSGWIVHRDWPTRGEQSAYVVVPKDKNEVTAYATSKIARSLGTALGGWYQ